MSATMWMRATPAACPAMPWPTPTRLAAVAAERTRSPMSRGRDGLASASTTMIAMIQASRTTHRRPKRVSSVTAARMSGVTRVRPASRHRGGDAGEPAEPREQRGQRGQRLDPARRAELHARRRHREPEQRRAEQERHRREMDHPRRDDQLIHGASAWRASLVGNSITPMVIFPAISPDWCMGSRRVALASSGAPNRSAIPVNRPRGPDYQAQHHRKNRGSATPNRHPA